MEIIILIVSLVIVLTGFFVMNRIDKINFENMSNENGKAVQCYKALVYGDCPDVLKYLHDSNIPCYYTKVAEIDVNNKPELVFALSDEDLENLLLCVKSRYMFPEVKTIGKCNNKIYEDIFMKSGIDIVITNNFTYDDVNLLFRKAGLL